MQNIIYIISNNIQSSAVKHLLQSNMDKFLININLSYLYFRARDS